MSDGTRNILLAMLLLVVAFTGKGISERLDRIAAAVEARR